MQLIRIRKVLEQTGHASRTTIYERMACGEFPSQVRLGPRAVGWLSTEIEAVIQAQVAGSSATQLQALVKRLHAQRPHAVVEPLATAE